MLFKGILILTMLICQIEFICATEITPLLLSDKLEPKALSMTLSEFISQKGSVGPEKDLVAHISAMSLCDPLEKQAFPHAIYEEGCKLRALSGNGFKLEVVKSLFQEDTHKITPLKQIAENMPKEGTVTKRPLYLETRSIHYYPSELSLTPGMPLEKEELLVLQALLIDYPQLRNEVKAHIKKTKHILLKNILYVSPSLLTELPHITTLSISGNGQYPGPGYLGFPPKIKNLTNLKKLRICHYPYFANFPKSFAAFKNLRVLELKNNGFKKIPDAIGNYPELTTLILEGFPAFESLPASLTNLKKLKTLILDNNHLKRVPKNIHKMTSIEWLSLQNNQLTSFDLAGAMPVLQTLKLGGNRQLTDVEQITTNCPNLAFLRLEDTNVSFPKKIMLSWFCFKNDMKPK